RVRRGVRGHRRSAGRGAAAPEHRTGPREKLTPEEVCKPDSVPPLIRRGQQPFVWSPGCPGDRATDPRERADHPRPAWWAGPPSYSVLLRVGFAEHPFSRTDLASSYLAFSPLLRAFGPGRSLFCGTFPRLLEAAVSGHPALWSPDFPPAAVRRAAARPPPAHGELPPAYSLASALSARQYSIR